MVAIYPFAAVRPKQAYAQQIASVPYDLVTANEARTLINTNPLSFLRVSRADAELPFLPPTDGHVYQRAKENFEKLLSQRIMNKDDDPSFYVYRVISGENIFSGLVACIDVKDYTSGRIRQHEQTQYEQEEDRTRHIDTVNAQTGLIFLVYRDHYHLKEAIELLIPSLVSKECEVKNKDGNLHQVFRLTDNHTIEHLQSQFEKVPELYIADGHHRAAAAVNVAQKRQAIGSTSQEAMRIMAVLFAHNQVMIHGYGRLVTDLLHYTVKGFINKLAEEFTITPRNVPPNHSLDLRDFNTHIIHMYLKNQWYTITHPVSHSQDIITSLDVVILQNRILQSILGITDPRRDPRLYYHGGGNTIRELENLVKSGRFAVAFAMQPIDINTVIDIADKKCILPPKSTWFEPKLLSGLLIHTLN